MIEDAKVDGTLCVLSVIYRLWASLRLTHWRDWVEGWLLQFGNGESSVEAWLSTETCNDRMSFNPLTRLTGLSLIVHLVVWACLSGSGRFTLFIIIRAG